MYCEICDKKIKVGDVYYADINGKECVCAGCITEVIEDMLYEAENVCDLSDSEVLGYGEC